MGQSAKRFAILAMLAALAPCALAQRGAGGGAHTAFHAGTGSNYLDRTRRVTSSRETMIRGELGRSRFDRRAPFDYLSLPFPFFDDAYDSGDMYSTGYPVAAPLPPYPRPASEYASDSFGPPLNGTAMRSQVYIPGQPLMIELQNGHYVQVSGAAIGGDASPLSTSAGTSSPGMLSQRSSENDANETNNLPPVVLIFKDGHQEQVRDYTIANGMLYARGDFYMDGFWNKQINLAALNLPETVEANASRNINFVLPSSPNEVIARF
jgi:hypothetical protein